MVDLVGYLWTMTLSPGEIRWIREKGQLKLSAVCSARRRGVLKRIELFDGWRVSVASVVAKCPKESDFLRPIVSHIIQTLEEALHVQCSYPHLVLTVTDARTNADLKALCTKSCYHMVTKPAGIKPYGPTLESFDWSMIPSQVHGVPEAGAAFLGHDQTSNGDFYRMASGAFRVVYSSAPGDFDEFSEPGRHPAQRKCAAIARLRCRSTRSIS